MAVAFVNASAPQVDFDNSIDLNMPASLVVGNLLVAVFRPSAGPVNAPAGWTMKRTGADALISVAYRRVTGSESATYTFTCAALNIFSDARCIQLSGVIATGDPFDATPVQNFVSNASSTALSLTTVTDNAYLLFVDAHNNDTTASTTTAPTSMTTRGGNPTQLHVFDQIQAVAGGTGNKIHTTSVSVNHYACLMAIKPVATQTVSPGGIASTSAVGSPTVQAGSVTVSPGGINSAATVGTPTVTPGSVTVSPSGIASTSAVGTPTVTAGQVTVSPSGIDSTALLGTPTVVPGTVTVSPSGIDSTALLGTPTVVPGAFTVEPSGIDSTALLGTPVVLSGFVTISPPGIGPTSGVGTPTVEAETIVTGTVYNHETGDPVGPGVTVKLFDDNDVLVDTTTTDGASVFTFYRPFGDTDTYWTLATYDLLGVQYHGVSDRGCPAV